MRDLVDASTCSPFPPVGTVAAPFGSPAVPHLRGYYGFVRLLATLPRRLRSPLAAGTPRRGSVRFPGAPSVPLGPGSIRVGLNRFARFGRDSELSWVHGKSN